MSHFKDCMLCNFTLNKVVPSKNESHLSRLPSQDNMCVVKVLALNKGNGRKFTVWLIEGTFLRRPRNQSSVFQYSMLCSRKRKSEFLIPGRPRGAGGDKNIKQSKFQHFRFRCTTLYLQKQGCCKSISC